MNENRLTKWKSRRYQRGASHLQPQPPTRQKKFFFRARLFLSFDIIIAGVVERLKQNEDKREEIYVRKL